MNDASKSKAELISELNRLRQENEQVKAQLAESERYRASTELLNTLSAAIVATDPNGAVVFWSNYAETLYGWTAEEALGKTTLELIATPDSLAHGEAIMHQLQQGQAWSGEYLARHKSGHQFPVYSVITPTYNQSGELNELVSYSYDITERKAREEVLRQSEANYRTLFETLSSAFVLSEFIFDDAGQVIDSRFVNVNPAFESFYYHFIHHQVEVGQLDSALLNERLEGKLLSQITSVSPKKWLAPFARVVQTGQATEVDIFTPTLQKHFTIIAFCPQPNHCATILVDITERKETEQALQEKEERYRQLFNFMPIGISVSDASGRIIDSNYTAEQLLGLSKEEHEGRHIDAAEWQVIDKDGQPLPPEQFASVRALQERRLIANTELGIRKTMGEVVWLNVTAAPLVGNPEQVIIAYTDITEKVEQEQKLKDTLQEKEILLKEIHHRVKNNMQTISSLLYKQQQLTDNPKTKAILSSSISRIRSMSLIHEKIYRSKSLAKINLADYIADLSRQLFHTYKQPQQNLKLHTQLTPVKISLDRAIPCALIINELITNALKYAFGQQKMGLIWLKLEWEGDQIVLMVRDNGQGLPSQFDVSDTTSLGLYLVYNLVTKQLAGTLEVTPRHPTEFLIRFKP